MKVDTVIQGDCLEVLKTIEDKTINCCVTSPPYYGLRDYGNDKQIGLEETPEEFIEKLVQVFREVKRVLKDDGTLWLNIGDSYNSNTSTITAPTHSKKQMTNYGSFGGQIVKHRDKSCKPKDLIGIPWMLAFALRNDGWYLRQDIIWHKPNPMPESVKDRFTKSHEYIFLLSKKPNYYFDHEAVQEESKWIAKQETNNGKSKYADTAQEAQMRQGISKERGNNLVYLRKNLPTQDEFVKFMRSVTDAEMLEHETDIKRSTIDHWFRTDNSGFSYPSLEDWIKIREYVDDWSEAFVSIDEKMTDVTVETDAVGKNNNGLRNKRDVWSVATKCVKEAHFATYPEELIEPCILAGCPIGGVVLDPFFGSGTTGRVATRLGRKYLGIELNPEYITIAENRTNNIQLQIDGFLD